MPGLTGAASMPRLTAPHPGNTIRRTNNNPSRRSVMRTEHFNQVHDEEHTDPAKVTPRSACKYCFEECGSHTAQIATHLSRCFGAPQSAKSVLFFF